MANGTFQVDEHDFEGMTAKQQRTMIYKTYLFDRRVTAARFKKLEQWKRILILVALIGGFAGGYCRELVVRLF